MQVCEQINEEKIAKIAALNRSTDALDVRTIDSMQVTSFKTLLNTFFK